MTRMKLLKHNIPNETTVKHNRQKMTLNHIKIEKLTNY